MTTKPDSISSLLPWLVVLAVLSLLHSPARAQCVSDGLETVPCCTPATATLPTFPPISDSVKYIGFRDCDPQTDVNLCVEIDAPIPAASGGTVCGIYVIKFTVRLCGGGMEQIWKGTLRAQYSRNWQETDASGDTIGVWRFLLNGDFRPTAYLLSLPVATNPAIVPPCSPSFGNNFYVAGFIDYALNCTTGTWTAAWSINHECDPIHHAPGSARPAPPLGFHPRRSYAWVGPGATFVADPVFARTAAGTTTQEAIRWNDWSSLPAICTGEETVSTADLDVVDAYCPCDPPGLNPQYDETTVSFSGACGSSGATVPLSALPFLQKRIGSWTSASIYPGLKDLALAMGDLEYADGCTGIPSTEFFEGVSTFGGFSATTYAGDPLGRQSLDIGSSNRTPINLIRQVGKPHVTQYIVNLNIDM